MGQFLFISCLIFLVEYLTKLKNIFLQSKFTRHFFSLLQYSPTDIPAEKEIVTFD